MTAMLAAFMASGDTTRQRTDVPEGGSREDRTNRGGGCWEREGVPLAGPMAAVTSKQRP